ncbi:undecaprenyl/decaprenyl-phosphate alpha-N-acetylglucosaminyl 1-phosphate transferase [Flavobacteriaceae bacterium]|nr:undecaprenyl/decaprenyl-phosphate alpha-N-acetylglucosaminyl 1-phosphate transferase [Flavobacteriaceae bacterium]
MNFDIALVLLIAVLLAALLYQPIHFICRELKIVDTPDWRKYDFKAIPLGGGFLLVAVSILGMIASMVLVKSQMSNDVLIMMLGALTLFITGIIDDLYQLRASIKLLVQIFVSFATLITSSILLDDFHGLFGVMTLGPMAAWLLTMVYLVVFINMFNLIDGIDGLASGIGIIGLVFILASAEMAHEILLSILICFLLGALIVLFVRNHTAQKMYLGDSGSLSLGYLMGCLTLHQLSIADISFPEVDFAIFGPVYAMTLFWYPLMDLGRIFLVRLYRGVSPFSPDKNHFHHKMVDRGHSHLSVSLVIMGLTLAYELLSFYLSKFMGVNTLFLVMFAITSLTAYILFLRPETTQND